jgi:hypothetical protein
MKRGRVPSECQALHRLFDSLWQTVLEPALANNPEGAHALALVQHRLIEIIRHGPEGIEYALSLLNVDLLHSQMEDQVFQAGLKNFEDRFAERLKAETKAESKAMKKRSGTRPASANASRKRDLPERAVLQVFFDDLWRLFLQPAIAETPDVGYAIALMHRRVAASIERGPKGIVCAISLLNGNVKQAFKHTRAYKEHGVSFNLYVRYLDGDKTPESELGVII